MSLLYLYAGMHRSSHDNQYYKDYTTAQDTATTNKQMTANYLAAIHYFHQQHAAPNSKIHQCSTIQPATHTHTQPRHSVT